MYILGNALLSRNFSFAGLKLNDKGLFYMNKKDSKNTNAPVHEILITRNPKLILSIMELDFDQVDKMNNETFIKTLIGCPYFNRKKFVDDVSDGQCILFVEMAEFLKNNEFDLSYEKMTMERIIEFFGNEGNWMDKLDKSNAIFNSKYTSYKILSGSFILEHTPDYDKTKLSSTLPKFLNEVFEDEIERDYFILTKSWREVLDYFLESTAETPKD